MKISEIEIPHPDKLLKLSDHHLIINDEGDKLLFLAKSRIIFKLDHYGSEILDFCKREKNLSVGTIK